MCDFLKKIFHIPKSTRNGIIEKPIIPVDVEPPEFVVNMEKFNKAMDMIRSNTERKDDAVNKED